jgi:hypothetical protein
LQRHPSQAVEDRLGLEDHAFAAPEGTVIHGTVAVVREGAQVVGLDRNQASLDGATEDAVVKRAGKETGEDRNDVEGHAYFTAADGSGRAGLPANSYRCACLQLKG